MLVGSGNTGGDYWGFVVLDATFGGEFGWTRQVCFIKNISHVQRSARITGAALNRKRSV